MYCFEISLRSVLVCVSKEALCSSVFVYEQTLPLIKVCDMCLTQGGMAVCACQALT